MAVLALSSVIPGAAWAQAGLPTPQPSATPLPVPSPAPVLKDDPADVVPPIKIKRNSKSDDRMSSTATRRPDHTAPDLLYRRRDNYFFQGATDLRYRSAFGSETNGTYIAATRFTVDYIRANPGSGDERGGARVQLLFETDNRGTATDRIRASELYAYYRFRFPGVTANVRVGQFVLPFGLIAVYDTPLQPIQPLYEKSLGLRVDTGTMLEGEYGPYHYAGSITTGSGPNRSDINSGRLYTFRLERTVETKIGRIQVGGSLLTGKGPVTSFETELPASGTSGARYFVNMTRFAGDGQYFLGPWTARGEIVFGANDQNPVWGYFAEGDYRVLPRLELVTYIKRWDFPIKPQQTSSLGFGANLTMGKGLILRALYEFERDVPIGSDPFATRRFTIQTRLNF